MKELKLIEEMVLNPYELSNKLTSDDSKNIRLALVDIKQLSNLINNDNPFADVSYPATIS